MSARTRLAALRLRAEQVESSADVAEVLDDALRAAEQHIGHVEELLQRMARLQNLCMATEPGELPLLMIDGLHAHGFRFRHSLASDGTIVVQLPGGKLTVNGSRTSWTLD